MCHGENKVDRAPFHFHFCNFDWNSQTAKLLELAIPNLHSMPYTITDQHYLDCYDQSRIVYLSPNAPTCLDRFSYDDVYIIGGIVDKGAQKPQTFARAKKENIRCARLPLDQHVQLVLQNVIHVFICDMQNCLFCTDCKTF